MNSRERVRKVLNHEIPDRVPIDLGSTRTTGISTIAYNRLREKISLKNGFTRMYGFVQQLAYPEGEIRDLFKVDIIDAGQVFLKSLSDWKKFRLNDGSDCLIPKTINLEIDDDGNLSPWLIDVTNDNVFMMSSDKLVTLCEPTPKLLQKYKDLLE